LDGVVAVTVAGGVAIMWSMQAAIEVDVVAASRGPLLVTVDEEGKTRVAQRFLGSAPVAGRLERARLRAGDRVEAGAVVATIRPADATPLDTRTAAQLQATLEAARDALAGAEAGAAAARVTAGFARAETARARLLAAAGARSRERACCSTIGVVKRYWEAESVTSSLPHWQRSPPLA
jgi:HlyD family secretion protein